MKNYLVCYYILQQCLYESLEDNLAALLGKISPELWENGKVIDPDIFREWNSVLDIDNMTVKQLQEKLAEKLDTLGTGFEKTISIVKESSFEYFLSQAKERMYKITWDKETGGVQLHTRVVEDTLGVKLELEMA